MLSVEDASNVAMLCQCIQNEKNVMDLTFTSLGQQTLFRTFTYLSDRVRNHFYHLSCGKYPVGISHVLKA